MVRKGIAACVNRLSDVTDPCFGVKHFWELYPTSAYMLVLLLYKWLNVETVGLYIFHVPQTK